MTTLEYPVNRLTQHGFEWGNVTVERMAEIKGYHVLGIKVNGEYRVEITVSPKGKKVRVREF